MEKYILPRSSLRIGLVKSLCAAFFAMVPGQVLAAGHTFEDRPTPPPPAQRVDIFDNKGDRRFIVVIPAEVLLARGKVDAVWVERRRRDLRIRNSNRRPGEPLVAYDFGGTLPDVLQSALHPGGGSSATDPDNRDDLAAKDTVRGVHGVGSKSNGLRRNEKADSGYRPDQRSDDQVQPLQDEAGTADGIGRNSLSGSKPLRAKVTVALVLWALAMGLIPFGFIWFGLARTFRNQVIGAGITIGCCLTAITCFSLFWPYRP